jgi:hypothetical protein
MDPAGMGRSASARLDKVGHAGDMYETGEVGGAIEKVIHDWPPKGRGGQLELEIRDATRAEAKSVALDAAYYLVGHGFGSTTFTITTNDIHCTQCAELAVHSSPAEPRCDHCGAPLPQVPGPAVVCREVAPCA